MKRAVLIIAAILMLTSCISYTVETGYSRISLPDEPAVRKETRFRLISEGKVNVTDGRAGVQSYPENPAEITYPFLYTVRAENLPEDSGITDIRMLVVPLGDEKLSEQEGIALISALRDITAYFTVLTGSLENQILGAECAALNAVTLRSGTILYSSGRYISSDGNSALFEVADGKDVEIAGVSLTSSIPSSPADIPGWLEGIDSSDDSQEVAGIIGGMADPEKILVLSSSEPSSEDWTRLTLRYRSERTFGISEMLRNGGWKDAYRATHFSPETDVGATRMNGEIYERMDFIYTQGLMPSSVKTFPVKGLTDTRGITVLLADIIVP